MNFTTVTAQMKRPDARPHNLPICSFPGHSTAFSSFRLTIFPIFLSRYVETSWMEDEADVSRWMCLTQSTQKTHENGFRMFSSAGLDIKTFTLQGRCVSG